MLTNREKKIKKAIDKLLYPSIVQFRDMYYFNRKYWESKVKDNVTR